MISQGIISTTLRRHPPGGVEFGQRACVKTNSRQLYRTNFRNGKLLRGWGCPRGWSAGAAREGGRLERIERVGQSLRYGMAVSAAYQCGGKYEKQERRRRGGEAQQISSSKDRRDCRR